MSYLNLRNVPSSILPGSNMMKSRGLILVRVVLGIVSLFSLGAGNVHAANFTFDFQNPSGVGSAYVDAISLNRAGALTVDGLPIGFTKNNSIGSLDNRLNLTSNGLEFNFPDTTVEDIVLGVPFNTAALGTTQVIARFSNVTGIANSERFEQFGIGWGDSLANTGGLDRAFVYATGSGRRSEVRSETNGAGASSDNYTTAGSLNLEILLNKVSATQLSGSFDYTGAGDDFSSGNVTSINGDVNNANSYGYVFMGNLGPDITGFSGVLTSISFIGPNLEIPAVAPIPEPASLTSLLLGLGLLSRMRRNKRGLRAVA